MQIRPYLSFKGECEEAIRLYERAFKSEVSEIMRFGDMPQDPENPMQIPDSQKNWILQAMLPFGNNFMRMSDSIGEFNDSTTDKIGIVVETSVDIVKNAFAILAEEGSVKMPLQETFFSPAYGIVYDKYGIMWNLAAMPDED
ncbi:MAG TPA: VOC family protein [Methanobacterium sp.]|nr:VOC family protein [Methanobacterium sp.]